LTGFITRKSRGRKKKEGTIQWRDSNTRRTEKDICEGKLVRKNRRIRWKNEKEECVLFVL
jgi:hypothetical protein